MQLPFGTYSLSKSQIFFLKCMHAISNGWIGRRICLSIRRIFTTIWSQKFFDYQIEGIKARFCVVGNVSEKKFFFMPQFYDQYERDFITKNLPENSVFLDIGANIGLYTLWVAKHLNKDGMVLAFEPNHTVFARLRNNVALNNFHCKTILRNIAIADIESEHAQLRLLDGKNLGSATLKSGEYPTHGTLTVKSELLLTALTQENIKNIDMLKIDVEGFEESVLLPFFQHAEKSLYPKFIIIENNKHLWKKDFLGYLLSLEYVIHYESPMNYILVLVESSSMYAA